MGFTSDQIFTQYIVEYSMKYFLCSCFAGNFEKQIYYLPGEHSNWGAEIRFRIGENKNFCAKLYGN